MSEPVTFLVRMSGEFVKHFFARTNGGDKVSMELGPANADGISEARFTVDYTDNLLRAAEQRIKELEGIVTLARLVMDAEREYDRVSDSDYTIEQINAAHLACNKAWDAFRRVLREGGGDES